jgi:carotenoid cleavage dioxygenase-like enzyme
MIGDELSADGWCWGYVVAHIEGRGETHIVDAYKVKPEPRFVVQASSKLEAFVHMQRTLAAYKLRQN